MEKIEMITEAVELIRDRVEHLSGKMGIVSTMMTGLVEKFVMGKITGNLEERVEKKTKKKPTRKKKK